MRKIILVNVFAFLSLVVFAQKRDSDGIASVQICYGFKTLNQNFQNNLNTIGNFKFNKPLQTIGLLFNGQLAYAARGHASGNVYYNQIIPQVIMINGTNKCSVTGFNFGASLGRDLFRKLEKFDLMLNFGFNTGRLRLYGDELTRQKNPYFAPKIGLEPRVKIGKLVISLTIEYDYDISRSTWRKTYYANSNKINIDKLRQTGLTTFIGIGYCLN